MQIIECVPNFSEGQNPQVVEQIIQAIQSVPETKLLHQQMDPSHNRSVLSFAGPPQAVLKSAFLAVQKAAELIDIRNHHGVHPRFGATDVMPIVPIQNISLEECVELARQLASRIQTELNIPTRFYEESGPRSLPEIRKNLSEYPINTSAGTTLIGVRNILIAYNINLASRDLGIAQDIAAKIRGPFVRALGFPLAHKNCVQVSTNLINYHKTKPLDVFHQVQIEAALHNVQILESEVIGLIPRAALPDDYRESLLLHDFSENQILENALGLT